MPKSPNFQSLSVRKTTLAKIEALSEQWEEELGVRMTYSQVIDRLIKLNETK